MATATHKQTKLIRTLLEAHGRHTDSPDTLTGEGAAALIEELLAAPIELVPTIPYTLAR